MAMRHRWLTSLLVGWSVVVLALSAAPLDAWAGEIQGTVTIKSSLRPRATGRGSSSSTDSGGYGYGGSSSSDDGAPTLSRDQEAQYVVISVAGKGLSATPKTYVMQQKGREFIPHVLPVVKGSNVIFTNEDPYLHSIYSESSNNPFILAKYSRGKKESKTFAASGPVELFCNIHSKMNAYIYVTESDFFAQPGKDRKYAIGSLPAGTYTVKIWHPRANPQTKTIKVPASGAVTLDVSL
jgi:plastocyanin